MRVRAAAGLLAAFAALLAAPGVPAARAQAPPATPRERMYSRVKPAVVFVEWKAHADLTVATPAGARRWQGGYIGYGTGWLISPDGFLVTNGHVVELYEKDNDETLKRQIFYDALKRNYAADLEKALGHKPTDEDFGKAFQELYPKARITLQRDLEVTTQNGERHPAEVKEYSPPLSAYPGKVSYPGYALRKSGKDVAVLKIEGKDFPIVRMGRYADVRVGETVHVAGYPGVVKENAVLSRSTALEASFTSGQVSSLKTSVNGFDVMQHDAATVGGNSGGPVFDDRGEVIGMHSYGSYEEGGKVQGFNFAIPVSAIREFVAAAGVDLGRPSLFDTVWDRALDAYWAGRWQPALDQFDMALRLMPGLPDAERMRRDVLQRMDEAPPAATAAATTAPVETGGRALPWRWIGLAAVLAAVVLAGGVLRKRRARAPGPAAPASVPARAPAPAGSLVVRSGPLAGNRFPVGPGGIRIGRDPDTCRIVLAESTVSRQHAAVEPGNGGVVVRNLSATNPTYVNGRPIQEATLAPGDEVRIGDTKIQFTAERPVEAAERRTT